MITLHGEEVKVGDRVWDMRRGWGEVFDINEESTRYPICVRLIYGCEWFTEDGKVWIEEVMPTLFWQPIEFEIPKKPKPKDKAWQWVCKSEGKYWLTHGYYVSADAVIAHLLTAEPIEPYLPSEIERLKVEQEKEREY